MKQIIASILGLVGLLTAPAAFAQSSTHTPFTQSDYYAVDYAQWAIKGQQPNYYLFSPNGLCTASASGQQFFPFATNAPVLITDATPANTEVVTPSTVTNASSQCGFTGSPANSHTSFQVSSGTAGLQEALNVLAVLGGSTTMYPARITLDRNWYAAAQSVPTTAAAIIAAAKGNAHAFLQDITSQGSTLYVWNGTAYVVGTWVNTRPTAAAGAAAGTAPTVGTSIGAALSLVQPITTGTATTTGTVFTETYATTSQFLYAPTCTVASSGTNVLTGLSVTTAFTASAAVVTVSTTATPAVSTAYRFTLNCK